MKKVLLTLFISLQGLVLLAQDVTGIVKDEQGKSLNNATVVLKKSNDSSVVKFAVTNGEGHFRITNINAGSYFINITHIGFQPFNSNEFEFSGNGTSEIPALQLIKASSDMKAVVVSARKPMIEVRADKTILNVEGSVNAVGQDALELLRKSPGVLLDKDDNISLSGKNGVQIYIDGRPTPMTGKDLADYLKTIQSSQIEAIEIITNPSAKYDAAGNGGIINIRLKKNKSFGTNGSVNAGYNIGIYPKYNGGFNMNHRNNKINLFGNYNYNQNRNESFMELDRRQLDTSFKQKSTMGFENKSHGFKAGADYFINSRQTVGIMANGTFGENEFINYSRTPIVYIPGKQTDRILIADNTSDGKRKNLNLNANYRYADTSGRELNIDADYGLYRIKNHQFQPNYYYDPTETTLIDSRIYDMVAPTDIDIYSIKSDYEQNFKKGRLGIGGKISFVESANDFQRFNVITSVKKLDTLRSNAFDYKENVNAAYINYNRPFKGFMIQLGFRVENTSSQGHSSGFQLKNGSYQTYDTTFKRDYTDVFPSAAITFNKNPANQWSLSYSRRIDRPAYQDLNPFEFKLDEYTYQKGNTELRPQYTNSFSITNTFKSKLTSTLNYSHVKDVFTQLIDTAETSKSFITKKNLATQDIVSLNVSYPFQYKWWSVFANLNTYYSKYEADFGTGRKVDVDVYAFNFYAQNSFKLGKGFTGEISGWYNSPSIWQGTFESDAMWSIDAGLSKNLFDGKSTIKASVSDIFQSMRWGGTSNFAGQYLRATGGFESRQFKLNFTYRFGSSQVKAARQRKTGLEDENKRVGNQGGGLQN